MSAGKLRELKNRIRSVENTKKITRAMEMVSAAKLRRFQNLMANAKPYTEGLENMLGRLHQAQKEREKNESSKKTGSMHPFFEQRPEARVAVVLITSDTGLCGPYNMDLIQKARNFFKEHEFEKYHLVGIGKVGISTLENEGRSFDKTYSDMRASRVEKILGDFKTYLEDIYIKKEVDSVYVVYSHFKSVTSYFPKVEKLLPFEEPGREEEERKQQTAVPYIFEPDPKTIFDRLVPVYFEAKTRMLFLEALVSEQIARMNAMHQATQNAKEMIDSLILQRNKARQALITKEIIEIVSGAEALRSK